LRIALCPAAGGMVSVRLALGGRLESGCVVYGMRTKTGKNSVEIRARTRGR
jgi:predicted deacylase